MDNPETPATSGTYDTGENRRAIKNGQSRNTGNIWHIRHRRKPTGNPEWTIQKHRQHLAHKTQEKTDEQSRMDNPETPATSGTYDTGENRRAIKNGQSRNTGNIWHIRHRRKPTGNPEWTIQKHRQHLAHKTQEKTDGQSRMDNPETPATSGT